MKAGLQPSGVSPGKFGESSVHVLGSDWDSNVHRGSLPTSLLGLPWVPSQKDWMQAMKNFRETVREDMRRGMQYIVD